MEPTSNRPNLSFSSLHSSPSLSDLRDALSTAALEPLEKEEHGTNVTQTKSEPGVKIIVKPVKEEHQRDPLLDELDAIPRFQPLLPWTSQNASRFQWTGLVAGAFARKETIAPEFMMDSKPMIALQTLLRDHLRSCAAEMIEEQAKLTDLMKHIDDYCIRMANSTSLRLTKSRAISDQLGTFQQIVKESEKTQEILDQNLGVIHVLQGKLPPELRLDGPLLSHRFPLLTRCFDKV